MNIGKTLYVTNRRQWRAWLKKNHATKNDIWLVYYRRESSKPRIPYNDAVEEALCFGWIDSILKKIDTYRFAQRFSPRRPKSQLSAMNRERVKRLIMAKKMTAAGLEAIKHQFHPRHAQKDRQFLIPGPIRNALMKDPMTWEHFQKFPESYKRIRVWWIAAAKRRPEVYKQRLRYFLKMTAQNKRFGMVQ
ncbi:MAG: YdeI/OmpD-associated family protein [Ignavibacteriales bacterium]|nr:YdeI/OmpD-associated family protein [Ignavibacteriales bacterium]